MWRRDFIRTAALSASAVAVLADPAEAAGARIVGEKRLSARTRDLTVRSPAMHADLKVRVILPRGWNRKRTWPVLWLLHGGHANYTTWSKVVPELEKLSAPHKVILVMPEGGNGGGYTNWMVGPQWETFHLVELRALLMKHYRANRRQSIAGLSAGGYGALIYAARHRGMFKMAASYSGYGSVLEKGAPEVLLTGIPGSGTEKFLMWGQPQVNRDVWEAHDPLTQAHRFRGTKLYISCARNGVKGPLDPKTAQAADPAEAFCWYTTKPLAGKLKKLKIPVTTHFYAKGTHSWPYFRYELKRSWPLLMKSLGA